jgi:hypothetical protein
MNFKNNTVVDFLIAIFLSHIYFRITFIETLGGEFSLVNQIKNSNVTSQSFFVESPTFTLLALGLGIDNLDIYKLLIYLTTLVSLFLIVLNVQYLESYSTLFILSGWLITSSWFLGYVDIISVVLMVLISKNIAQDNISVLRTGVYFLLLCLNHNAISIGVSIIYLIFTKKRMVLKVGLVVLFSQLIGNLLIQLYLNSINFAGRGRLRFVFNDNVIENATSFVGKNILVVLWSGFFGILVIMVLTSNTLIWSEVKKILITVLIALFFTSIALDTSRVFSLLVVPISMHVLNIYKKDVNFNHKLSFTYTITVLLIFIIGVYYFHGSIHNSSPMNEAETFYDFIPRITNSLMSNIWK